MNFILALRRLPRATVDGVLGPLRALRAHRDLFVLLVRRDFTDRTSGTVLGFSWLLLQPALQAVAFWFLLDLVLQVRFPGRVGFVDYFLIGMVPWLMMSEALSRSAGVLPEMAPLYRRMAFPVELLPLLPLTLGVLIYGVVYAGVVAAIAGPARALLAPLVVAGVMLWLLPFVYLVAVTGLFIRDFRQFLPFVLTMAMYLTPVLYMPQMLPEAMRFVLVFNPFADVLAVVHHVVHDLPLTPGNLLRPGVLWLLVLGPAWVLFRRAQPHMREAL